MQADSREREREREFSKVYSGVASCDFKPNLHLTCCKTVHYPAVEEHNLTIWTCVSTYIVIACID